MKTTRVGRRGLLASFDDPYFTNVYVIQTESRVFVLDTFLGSSPMHELIEFLNKDGFGDKPVIIFNSHADYDHYWGNDTLKPDLVIGHTKCRERILSEGVISLQENKQHKRGEVLICPPNLTFRSRLHFPEDNIHFFYSPGHTLDSASCYDGEDKVLFVGDNVESPIPLLNHPNFDEYMRTLSAYLKYEWNYLVAGHDPLMKTPEIIRRNMEYLRGFIEWNIDLSQFDKAGLQSHINHNLRVLRDQLIDPQQKENYQRHLREAMQYLT